MGSGNFTFLCRTKTSYGKNALDHLPFDLFGMGAQKPLILQDHAADQANLAKPLTQAFKESEMILGICPGVGSESLLDMEKVKPFYQLYMDKGFDSIVALGAGQVVDLAKALNIAVSFGPESLAHTRKEGKIRHPLVPFVYLPAGAVTGMETSDQLLFNGRTLDTPELAPDLVVIDEKNMMPGHIETLIPQVLTALSICCESFVMSKNPAARAYASTGIGLVVNHLYPLLGGDRHLGPPGKVTAKELAALIHASVISGILLANGKDLISVHLGKMIAETYSVKPGHAMAVILPAVLEVFEGVTTDLGRLLLPLSGQDEFSRVPALQQPGAAVQKLRDILNLLFQYLSGKSPRVLADLGLDATAADTVSGQWRENKALETVFLGLDPEKIKQVLVHSFDGRPVHLDQEKG